MSTLVVEQPNYIPWLGYFDLLDRADLWVWYDDVQYTKRDWRNRNRVAGDGAPIWLTIPVQVRRHRDRRISEIEIDHRQPWVRKHLKTLQHLYGNAPYFAPVFQLVKRHLEAEPKLLADLTIELAEDLAEYLGIEVETWRSSELENLEGSKQDRILSVCRRFQPSVYLSGPAARDYLNPGSFVREGIELKYISYCYGGYPRGGQAEQTRLSIVDPLVWVGPAATLELIRDNQPEEGGGGMVGR